MHQAQRARRQSAGYNAAVDFHDDVLSRIFGVKVRPSVFLEYIEITIPKNLDTSATGHLRVTSIGTPHSLLIAGLSARNIFGCCKIRVRRPITTSQFLQLGPDRVRRANSEPEIREQP